MSEDLNCISPFALSDGTDGPEFSNEFGTAAITEVKVPSIVCLAGRPQDENLPAANNIQQVDESTRILALAPDQWLFINESVSADELLRNVQSRYQGKTVVCADHSQAWTVLRLSGTAAEKCLSRLCPVDLHPDVFDRSRLIQTNMAGIYVLCVRTLGRDNSYDLYVSHSYSRSFFKILRDAAGLG